LRLVLILQALRVTDHTIETSALFRSEVRCPALEVFDVVRRHGSVASRELRGVESLRSSQKAPGYGPHGGISLQNMDLGDISTFASCVILLAGFMLLGPRLW